MPDVQYCLACSLNVATTTDGTVPLCQACAKLIIDRRGVHFEVSPLQLFEESVLSFLQNGLEECRLKRGPLSLVSEAGELFTLGVAILRSGPNPQINKLTTAVWEVYGNRIVNVVWGLDFPSLSLLVIQKNGTNEALVSLPKTWAKILQKDVITQLGAIVNISSQALDYACGRFDDPNVCMRARAWEADFLMTLVRLFKWESSLTYHQELLAEFPEGVSSPNAQGIIYPIKPLNFA